MATKPEFEDFTVGFELEFEGCSVAEATPRFADLGDVKYDGTVPTGFELASKVFAAKNFSGGVKNPFFKVWQAFFGSLNELNVSTESPSGAGQHVHAQRDFLSCPQIQSLNSFVVNYGRFTQKIGGRNFGQYCKAEVNSYAEVSKHVYPAHISRYRAINVRPANTIEFRFFKSTRDLSTFLKNMQYVLSTMHFVKHTNFLGEDCAEGRINVWSKFCQFVDNRKSFYPYLHKFLTKEGLIAEERETEETEMVINGAPYGVTPQLWDSYLRNIIQKLAPSFPVITPNVLTHSARYLNPQQHLLLSTWISKTATDAIHKRASRIRFA